MIGHWHAPRFHINVSLVFQVLDTVAYEDMFMYVTILQSTYTALMEEHSESGSIIIKCYRLPISGCRPTRMILHFA